MIQGIPLRFQLCRTEDRTCGVGPKAEVFLLKRGQYLGFLELGNRQTAKLHFLKSLRQYLSLPAAGTWYTCRERKSRDRTYEWNREKRYQTGAEGFHCIEEGPEIRKTHAGHCQGYPDKVAQSPSWYQGPAGKRRDRPGQRDTGVKKETTAQPGGVMQKT